MTKTVRSPIGARGAETRAQILEAAGHVFGNVGFRKTTMTEVADAAGISKATVYLYFENKRDLYSTLVREMSQLIYEQNRAAVSTRRHLDGKLRAYIVARYRNVRELLARYDAQTQYLQEDRAETREAIAELATRELDLVKSILEEGRRAGEVGDIDTHLAAVAITGTLRSLDTPWIFNLEPVDVEERAGDLVQIFLRGLAPRKDDA